MHVPFIDLKRIVKVIKEGVMTDWESCLDNTEFVGGSFVTRLERKLEQTLDVPHVISCANGTDAIVVALQAMGIGPGKKVALPNMTFWAPYEAIVAVGAEPVLIDIDNDDLQMDFDEFQEAYNKVSFHAAILVHLFGWTSRRLAEYRSFCEKNGIVLIEDGAQAYGVKSEGKSVYSNCQISTISFYPAKVLGASCDAGAIMTPNPKVAELVRALCNHGRAGHYTYDYIGWNARLGSLAASYLLRKLDIIDELLASRVRAEKFYQNFFRDYPELVKVYEAPEGTEGNGYLSVALCKSRSGDDVASRLKAKGIGCARTYPQTLDMQPPAMRTLRISDLRKSRSFSENVINLPLFAYITEEECAASAQALLEALTEK
jgi:dTDP-4-amino-4,6-dideoxygalactose transaminase